MLEKELGLNSIPETQQQFTQPDLQNNKDEVSSTPSRFTRFKEQLDRKKFAITGAGAIAATPTIVGLAEGLEPRDAVIYGILQWLSLGIDERDGISETTQEILSGGIQTVAETGFVVSGVKAFLDNVNRTAKKREAILGGSAVIHPEGEQIVMLGGSGSRIIDALAASTERENIIPVLESSHAAHELLFQYEDRIKSNKPFYLNLGIDTNGNQRTRLSYLETHAWDQLQINKENLIQADNGHRYLLVVGCGETSDRELSFNPQNVDVTHDDLRSAVLRLKGQLNEGDLVEPRDIIDMYIGNADIDRKSAENRLRISDRELAKKTGVDIYVDTWGFVLRELAERIAEGGSNEVALATTNDEYEMRFRTRFAGHITNFAGCEDLQLADIDKVGEDAIWIVYEGPSDETFQTARRLRKLYPERRLIALLSNDKVENYAEKAEVENVEFISASSVLAKTVIGVKQLIKRGYTPQQIQDLLDEYAPPIPSHISH